MRDYGFCSFSEGRGCSNMPDALITAASGELCTWRSQEQQTLWHRHSPSAKTQSFSGQLGSCVCKRAKVRGKRGHLLIKHESAHKVCEMTNDKMSKNILCQRKGFSINILKSPIIYHYVQIYHYFKAQSLSNSHFHNTKIKITIE